MMPNQKNIMLRFSFIILVMVLIGIAIICKAGVIMFAERQYWKDVADRFVKENVTVRPTRGNIISSDGQLMASSLPEYKIYMDFMINKRKGETEEEEKTRLKLQHIKDSVLYANLDTICKGLHEIFPDKSAAFFKQLKEISASEVKGAEADKKGKFFSVLKVFSDIFIFYLLL